MSDPRELSRQGVEVWKDIPGFDNYQASNLGRIRSVDRVIISPWRGKTQSRLFKGRILKPVSHKKSKRHVNVCVSDGSINRPKLVHHLVLLAFDGPRPSGEITRHLDGNGGNNVLHNICYGTHTENRYDDVAHGLYQTRFGEGAGNVKLTENEVIQIKRSLKNYKRGMTERLAAQFNVTSGAIANIKSGRTWSHIE
jgi:hypothetical protein